VFDKIKNGRLTQNAGGASVGDRPAEDVFVHYLAVFHHEPIIYSSFSDESKLWNCGQAWNGVSFT